MLFKIIVGSCIAAFSATISPSKASDRSEAAIADYFSLSFFVTIVLIGQLCFFTCASIASAWPLGAAIIARNCEWSTYWNSGFLKNTSNDWHISGNDHNISLLVLLGARKNIVTLSSILLRLR